MQDPEAYLRAMAAPLAWAQEGSPLPVTRFSVEAVANAFVMLGLLPAARAEEILAAQRQVLEAAGFRVGLEIGELSVGPGARGFQEARARGADSLQRIPLAVAAGPVRCPLRGGDLVITSATLTPEGIWLRYCGDPRESDRHGASALIEEIHEKITELSVTDDTGGTYEVPAGNLPGAISGRRSGSGRTRWIPEGEFLGGAIAPGLQVSSDAAAARSAALRRVELTRPRSVVGKNTVECMQAGAVFGFAGLVDGLVARIREDVDGFAGDDVAIVATGHTAPLLLPELQTVAHYDQHLTLHGLRLIFERNRDAQRGRLKTAR